MRHASTDAAGAGTATGPGASPGAAAGTGTATHPAVRRVELLGRLLDDAVPVPGTDQRIGLDPLVGVLPIAGDTVAALVSVYIVLEAVRLGVGLSTLARMSAYVAIDVAVGSIPVVGTVFDAVWTANAWNARLLARHVDPEGASGSVSA